MDLLMQIPLRSQHHTDNLTKNLEEGIIPTVLQYKKKPTFESLSTDFDVGLNFLSKAEQDLVSIIRIRRSHCKNKA